MEKEWDYVPIIWHQTMEKEWHYVIQFCQLLNSFYWFLKRKVL